MSTRTLPSLFAMLTRMVGIVLLATTITEVRADNPVLVVDTSSSAPRTYSPSLYPAQSSLVLQLGNNPVPAGTLQWYHDDSPIPGATTPTLTLNSLSAVDAGNYRLSLSSTSGATYSDTIVVNVLTAPSTVDATFVSQLPADFHVADVTAFASDGSFIALSTDPAMPPVRVAADGSVVPGFRYALSNGDILAGFPDGRLIVSNSPYVLSANGSPSGFVLPGTFDWSKPLTSAAVAADGRFYLAQGNTIVGLLPDGSVDPSFSFSNPLDNTADILGVDRQNRLLVRGVRVDPDSSHYPPATDVIYRLSSSGSVEKELLRVDQMKGDRGRAVLLGDGRILAWSSYEGIYTWSMFNEDGTQVMGYTGSFYTDRGVVIDAQHGFLYRRSGLPFGERLSRSRFGATGVEPDQTFYAGPQAADAFPAFRPEPSGKLLVFTNTDAEGHALRNLARLRTDVPLPPLPPYVSINASDTNPQLGATVTLAAWVGDSNYASYGYRWIPLDRQPLPQGVNSGTATISNFSQANLGRYQLQLTGAFGAVLSNVVAFGSGMPYLANLSGRAVPGSGENTTIAGFTVRNQAGAPPSLLLIRGVGPALKPMGVSNFLPNPAVNLLDRSGTVILNNDNWSANPYRDTIRSSAAAAGAFALPESSLDAAVLLNSFDEQYTAQLFDMTGQSGVGLLEVYRVPTNLSNGELTNLSLRAHTGPGDGVAIAGFVIVDPVNFGRSARVLLRVVGPTLSRSGIQHPLADPVLALFNAKGELVRRVDNWSDDSDVATLTATMKQVGAFDLPAGSKDAAVVLDLPAGVYSMHAEGGEGVALLEIYLVR